MNTSKKKCCLLLFDKYEMHSISDNSTMSTQIIIMFEYLLLIIAIAS